VGSANLSALYARCRAVEPEPWLQRLPEAGSSLPSWPKASQSDALRGADLFRADRLWEGHHESRRCSRDTYPESYITKYASIRRKI